MDKTALKKFATSARTKLRQGIENRLMQFGVGKESIDKSIQIDEVMIVNGQPLQESHEKAYRKLMAQLYHLEKTMNYQESYDMVVEKVAYTWFNRIIAIRYMEMHDYLPIRMRVLSSERPGKMEPDAVTNSQEICEELKMNQEEVWKLQEKSNMDDLFKYVLVHQCHQLGEILPNAFHKLDDIEELLLPDNLLSENGVIYQLVHSDIPDGNWDEVEIVGWLYQYYNSEVKEQVGGLKNSAVSKGNLPTVTQLFTPKWIVQYMLQNSLGKIYCTLFPHSDLYKSWDYYFDEAEQKPYEIPNNINILEDIKVIDPACGSGHILLEAFDLLFSMYEEQGYMAKEIPAIILKHNLFGLEIDDRSYQITEIALLLKTLEKYPRYLRQRKHQSFATNVQVFQENTTEIPQEALLLLFSEVDIEKIRDLEMYFENSKQYGSLLKLPEYPYDEWVEVIEQALHRENLDMYEEALLLELAEKMLPLIQVGHLLTQYYSVVCTNPPYHNKYNAQLKKFMNKNYPMTKSDLYSAFIEKTFTMTEKNGFSALMTPYTWMFIVSHEKLRKYIIENGTISNLVQLEYSAFEDATVPICTFILQNQKEKTTGVFVRLEDFKGAEIQPIKVKESCKKNVDFVYTRKSEIFRSIPRTPIAYWAEDQIFDIYSENIQISDVGSSKKGLDTSNNKRFLRLWHEIDIRNDNWKPLNKGGYYRKWYGNQEYVVDWYKKGERIKNYKKATVRNEKYYFEEGITWTDLTSGRFNARYFPQGFIFEATGPCYFGAELFSILGYMNSVVFNHIAKFTMSTMHYTNGSVAKMPYIPLESNIEVEVKDNIQLSKSDWDSFESSWDFEQHPFFTYKGNNSSIKETYQVWENEALSRFNQLQKNEEELNRIFIDLYGLQEELTPEVPDKEVTVRKADLSRDVRSFLSYLVGIMFGRYSLDEVGLVFAGGTFDRGKYRTYQPDEDNIIPITTDGYVEQDIVDRVVDLVQLIFGEDACEENLQFIANGLDGKLENEKEVDARACIRKYFVKDFYKDHLKIYQKRPIYWEINSGRNGTFKGLLYLHRYDEYALARVRTDYVLPLMKTLQGFHEHEQVTIDNSDMSKDVARAKKKQEKWLKEVAELRTYDLVLQHMANQQIELDLDDGVKVNYEKFQNIEITDSEQLKTKKMNIFTKI